MDKSPRSNKRKRISPSKSDASSDESSDQLIAYDLSSEDLCHGFINYLSLLSPDIFAHLCLYLGLSTKLTCFRLLNKHFQSRLDPPQHCKHDTLVINQAVCRSLDETAIKDLCAVIELVPIVHIDFDCAYDTRSSISTKHLIDASAKPPNDAARQSSSQVADEDWNDSCLTSVLQCVAGAMTNCNLRTLNFSECSQFSRGDGDLEALSELIEEVEAVNRPITIQQLTIELKGERLHSSAMDYEFIPWIDISSLFRSDTLHTVKLKLYGCEWDDLPEQLQTLVSLPPSVTWFELFHDWKFGEHVLQSLLSNPGWLPNIRHLDLDCDIMSDPSLLTIMRATGQPRPYQHIEMMLADETLASAQFAHLEHLGLVLDCSFWSSFDQFLLIDRSAFPQLKSFSLNEEFGPRPDGQCDLNPLIMFLSQRPIEKLVLRLWIDGASAWAPLSDESVLALATIQSLTQFRLDYLTAHESWPDQFVLFESEDIRDLLLPNSWPHISELALIDAMPITAMEAFCHASPALKTVVWRHQSNEGLIPLALLSMINKHCPSIEKISLYADHSAPTFPHDVFYAASLHLNLTHLHTLHIHDDKLTGQTLHLLITKIMHAPIIDFMLQTPPPDSVRWSIPDVAMQMVMQRKLRKLRYMWFPKDLELISSLESMNRQLSDGRTFPFSSLELMPEDPLVRVRLACGVDDVGQTSLDTVCNALLQFVRPIDQRYLQLFDEGNYDVAGWQRTQRHSWEEPRGRRHDGRR